MKRTVSNFLRALCSLTLEHIRVIKLNHYIRVASCDIKVKRFSPPAKSRLFYTAEQLRGVTSWTIIAQDAYSMSGKTVV